jgi:hypothetical protein
VVSRVGREVASTAGILTDAHGDSDVGPKMQLSGTLCGVMMGVL